MPPSHPAFAGESERVEWKSSASDVDMILHAVAALANDLGASGDPGFLVVGLDNRGHPTGVDHDDEAIQRLVNRITSIKILPSPSVTVSAVPHGAPGSTNVLIVEVRPYPVPPVVTVDGVGWVRVGTTTRRATQADLVRLGERRPAHLQPFDIRPVVAAGLDALSLANLRATYAGDLDADGARESFPPFEPWLAQRDIVRRVDNQWHPTVVGLLVHGISPQDHFPGAIVEVVRYAGTDYDAPVVWRKTATGRLSDQLEAVWAQLGAHLTDRPSGDEGARTAYLPEYPLDALRELSRNLVQHRLYEGTNAPGRIAWLDDRIVFNNPGGPYGQASEGEFGTHSDYRNPAITKALVEAGYVERLGRGVRLARAMLAKNGNPPLETEIDGFTTVTVRRRP